MDSEKFDDLIKRIGTARVSRLTALKGLAGGALAAATGLAIATDDTEAAKKRGKKKGKKKSRRSANYAPPVYNAPAPPKEEHKPTTSTTTSTSTTAAPQCPKEYCDKGQEWSYDTCRCECKEDGYKICESTYDEYAYLKGTCVNTHCENDYDTYNERTCKCEPIVCDNVYDCGAYGRWDKKTCSCECDEYYEVCTSTKEYVDPAYYGTCIYTKCDGYESEYFTYDSDKCACICNAPADAYNSCEYGYKWSDEECHCVEDKKTR